MEKIQGNNANARKSINTLAKPIHLWKIDEKHTPTKTKMLPKKQRNYVNSGPFRAAKRIKTRKHTKLIPSQKKDRRSSPGLFGSPFFGS